MASSPLARLFKLLKAHGLLASLTPGMAAQTERSNPSKKYRDLLESLKTRDLRFVVQWRAHVRAIPHSFMAPRPSRGYGCEGRRSQMAGSSVPRTQEQKPCRPRSLARL